MHMLNSISRLVAVVLVLIVIWIGYSYVKFIWPYRTKVRPIVLEEDAVLSIDGRECRLPKGVVLYPLNDLECCSDVYEGDRYKIYIEPRALKVRELSVREFDDNTNLVHCLGELR